MGVFSVHCPTVVRPLDSDKVVIRRWKGGNYLKSSNKKKIDPIADRPSCISSDWKGFAPSLPLTILP